MLWSLPETLKFIEPYLPGLLVSPELFSQVKTIAHHLPDVFSSYYLECRLGAEASQVDFLTSVTIKDGRQILAEQQGEAGLPNSLLEYPVWGHIRGFFKNWADPASPLYEQIPIVWLEFDNVAGPLPQALLPGACFCLDPKYLGRPALPQDPTYINAAKYRQVTDTALTCLFGQPLPAQTKENLFDCFDLLPAGGRIIYISAMLSRQPPALKVYGCIPQTHLFEYLAQIGWTGSPVELEKIISLFCPSLTPIFIDLTVGEKIASRIGIAFSQIHLSLLPQSDPKWQALLDQLVENGLCTPAKREALLSWPGYARELYELDTWPTRLSRWLDIKLVYQPDQPLEAKGYLGFMPIFSFF